MTERLIRHLSAASEALRSLEVGDELEPHVAVEQLYASVRDAEAELAQKSSALSALAAAVLGHLDRVRSHRVALGPDTSSTVSRALLLLQGWRVVDDSIEAEALSMAAVLCEAWEPLDPGDDDWQLFIGESLQLIDVCGAELRALSGNPDQDAHFVQRAFRALHTFKGNCGLVGAARLELLARAGEDALSGLRSGELASTAGLRAALSKLILDLRDCLSSGREDGEAARLALVEAAAQARRVAGETRLGELLVAQQLVDALDVQAALEWKARPLGEVLVELRALTPDSLEHALAEQRRLREGAPAVARSTPTPKAAPKLLPLMADRVKELVAAAEALIAGVEPSLHDPARRVELSGSVGALRNAIERLTLMPVASVLRRAELAVNGLTKAQGKRVTLTLQGGELELPHAVLDVLSTVILHGVRNAIDHGIELPAERVRAAKPPAGSLRVTCAEVPGGVALTIADDGRGLDRAAILARAKAMNVQPADDSEEALLELIFLPGFSTSPTLSDSSGRGVGMDAMRAKVEAVGGILRLSPNPGGGTTLRAYLPGAQASGSSSSADDERGHTSGTWITHDRAAKVRSPG